MTIEDMNEMIAEECGWTDIRKPYQIGMPPEGYWRYWIPDFCRDLNAMHQAEQALWARDWGARARFVDALARILNPVHGYANQSGEDLLDAAAEDRAKAFLIAVGKWKEGE